MVTDNLDIKYTKEASELLNVPASDLREFMNFIIKLTDEKMYTLLNSSGTTITENISKFLYNLHFHHMITLSTDAGGLRRLSEDEITRLSGYINKIAEKINGIKQESVSDSDEKSEQEPIKEDSQDTVQEEKNEFGEHIEKITPEVANWIERGQKILPEDKREKWAEYVKESVNTAFMGVGFDTILDLMEKISTLSNREEIGNLIDKSKYTILGYDTLKNVIKEFLDIDIDKTKEEKNLSFEEKLGEQLEKIKKAREEAVEGKEVAVGVHGKEYIIEPTADIELDGMNVDQDKDKENAEIAELERRKQAKEIELEKAHAELLDIKSKYTQLNTLYRAAIYGTKDRVSTQITGEQSSINYYEEKAAKMARIAKKDRNRRLLNIFVNPGDSFAELSDEEKEKGFFGRIAAMWEHEQQDYKEELKDIERDTASKTQQFKDRIAEYNAEIEANRKKLGKLGRSITDKCEEIKVLEYELYEITQELTKLKQGSRLNQSNHDLKSDGQDR